MGQLLAASSFKFDSIPYEAFEFCISALNIQQKPLEYSEKRNFAFAIFAENLYNSWAAGINSFERIISLF